ncbi:MAG: hypothetical protein IPP40_13720 [bacterium]|nr:hypothetical protein [bacterium]
MLRATIRTPGQENHPPEITAATPTTLDTVVFNTTVNFAVVAEDPDGQTLNYQWYHNGNAVGTNSPTYNHRFITLNANTIKCRVCDFEFCDSTSWTPWVRLGTGIGDEPGFMPQEFAIEAFPNPFNPLTTIDFALPQQTQAKVVIHNLAGQEVAVLQDGPLSRGRASRAMECRRYGFRYILRSSQDSGYRAYYETSAVEVIGELAYATTA